MKISALCWNPVKPSSLLLFIRQIEGVKWNSANCPPLQSTICSFSRKTGVWMGDEASATLTSGWRGGVLGVKCFLKSHVPLSMHFHIPHWPVWPLQYALVKKSSCPSSPAACADARAPNVHKWQPHWHPPKLFTDPLLRLTSASALSLWHFLGHNSKLSGLTDWNTELKLRREDPSFSHCTLPSSWHSSDLFCCNYPERFVYYLLCDSLHERLEEFCFVETQRKRWCFKKYCIIGQDQQAEKEQEKLFLLC